MVSAILAIRGGLRKLEQATRGPISRVRVVAASAASSDQASQAPCWCTCGKRKRRWSGSQKESKPTSSARRAIAAMLAQRRLLPLQGSSKCGTKRPILNGLSRASTFTFLLHVYERSRIVDRRRGGERSSPEGFAASVAAHGRLC